MLYGQVLKLLSTFTVRLVLRPGYKSKRMILAPILALLAQPREGHSWHCHRLMDEMNILRSIWRVFRLSMTLLPLIRIAFVWQMAQSVGDSKSRVPEFQIPVKFQGFPCTPLIMGIRYTIAVGYLLDRRKIGHNGLQDLSIAYNL